MGRESIKEVVSINVSACFSVLPLFISLVCPCCKVFHYKSIFEHLSLASLEAFENKNQWPARRWGTFLSTAMYTRYSGLCLALISWAEAELLPRQDEGCAAIPAVTVAPHVVEYPLHISTYISANTVINIDGNGNNITINNAPTTLDLLTTGTAQSSATITASGLSGTQTSSGSSASGSTET